MGTTWGDVWVGVRRVLFAVLWVTGERLYIWSHLIQGLYKDAAAKIPFHNRSRARLTSHPRPEAPCFLMGNGSPLMVRGIGKETESGFTVVPYRP